MELRRGEVMFGGLTPKHRKTMDNNTKKQFAFTLIELLVVIAIIGILSALIVVGMNSTTQKASIAKSQVFANSLRNSLMGNLVSEWRLDNGSGTTATDSWSGGNTGTLNGFGNTTAGYGDTHTSGWMSSSNCISGTCLKFDGGSNYIIVPDNNLLDITSNMTISFWIKQTASAYASKGILDKGNSGGAQDVNYYVYTYNGSAYFYVGNLSTYVGVQSLSFLENQWCFMVFVLDGTELISYTNGIKKTPTVTRTINPVANNESLKIGDLTDANNFPFSGSIDEVRIFDAAMPTSQIQQDYFAGINKLFAKNQITQTDYQQRLAELSNNYVKE